MRELAHLPGTLGRALLLGMLLLLLTLGAAALEIPKFDPQQKFVTDLTATLTPEQKRQLSNKLEEIERSDSTQIAVLMIPSLQGEDLFDYSHRVAQAWGIGQKGKDNGVLLLISKGDRKMFLQVGYGLEGRLPDATAQQIIRHQITPNFRAGRYYEGIHQGTTAIVQAVRGEYKATASPAAAGSWGMHPALIVFLILFLGIWAFIILSWFMGASRASRRRPYRRARGWHAGVPIGGMGGGWSSGGRRGGGGGGFGGGSFGGGGASGSW